MKPFYISEMEEFTNACKGDRIAQHFYFSTFKHLNRNDCIIKRYETNRLKYNVSEMLEHFEELKGDDVVHVHGVFEDAHFT